MQLRIEEKTWYRKDAINNEKKKYIIKYYDSLSINLKWYILFL